MTINLLLFSALLASAIPATAQSPAEAPNMRRAVENVRFSDLDLATARGQKRLRARIGAAAVRVCSDTTSGTPLPEPLDRDCVHAALDNAIAQVERGIALRGRAAAVGRR